MIVWNLFKNAVLKHKIRDLHRQESVCGKRAITKFQGYQGELVVRTRKLKSGGSEKPSDYL